MSQRTLVRWIPNINTSPSKDKKKIWWRSKTLTCYKKEVSYQKQNRISSCKYSRHKEASSNTRQIKSNFFHQSKLRVGYEVYFNFNTSDSSTLAILINQSLRNVYFPLYRWTPGVVRRGCNPSRLGPAMSSRIQILLGWSWVLYDQWIKTQKNHC